MSTEGPNWDRPAFERIKAPDGSDTSLPDKQTQQEMADLELQQKKEENDKLLVEIEQLKERKKALELQNRDLEQNIRFRKVFAGILFAFTCLWIVVVTSLIICFSRPHGHFSDTVSVTLLGTTTVNVFAFFRCVTNYLFPSPQNQSEGDKAKTGSSKSEV